MESRRLFFDRCKCCLENGLLKNLWGEYINDGQSEVYGKMITECFALTWQKPEQVENICELCIERVRDAYNFKKEVLASEQLLMEHWEETQHDIVTIRTKIKSENSNQDETEESLVDFNMQYNTNDVIEEERLDSEEDHNIKEELEESDNQEEYLMDSDDENTTDEELEFNEDDSQDNVPEYLEVEYLDDDNSDIKAEEKQTIKEPKNKKKDKRSLTYRKYTEDDLRQALYSVKNKYMSRSEASANFNVPVKTIGAKLRAEAARELLITGEDANKDTKSINMEKQSKFIEEIKTILTYTNATAYKSKTGRYYCAYCSTDGPIFHDPDELRTHTRTKHAMDRIRTIGVIMRPYYLNEVIKLDIDNLQCTICCTPIKTWNDMYIHLHETHNVDLDQAYTRVIPYRLQEELSCALCEEKFPAYHMLDAHMNSHYNNYICGECGDSFLAETRLKKHIDTHSVKKYPCNICGKVFTLEKYRKKHIDYVHNKAARIKCLHCSEKFKGEYARHLHVLDKHKGKVRKFTCDMCNRTFDWRPYYLKHMRLMHKKREKKHRCKLCDKVFMMKYELKNHEDWHRGESSHVCSVCNKKFTSKAYLQKHYKIHLGESTTTLFVVD